jgi:hypothetical protein
MTINGRLDRLERRARGEDSTEADLRAKADAVAREHDLPVEEVLTELKRILAMPPADRDAYCTAVLAATGHLPPGRATHEARRPAGEVGTAHPT